MTHCANDHESIEHDEFHCPLCAALDDINELTLANEEARGKLIEAEERLDHSAVANVEGLERGLKEAHNERNQARNDIRVLKSAIRAKVRAGGMRAKLEALERTLLEIETKQRTA